jgi:hypothetical protein
MIKNILAAMAVIFSLAAPAFASGVVYQEEPASGQPAPAGEGESSGGGGD